MPGLNQRGPEGRGAMTGRRQGICTGAAGQQLGGGRGRGCRRGGGGRGSGQAFSRGFGPAYDAGPVQYTQTRTSLEERSRILEDELKRVKEQLNTISDNE